MNTLKSKFSFNWLLSIQKSSSSIFIILLQPFYIIWIFKIAQLGERITGEKQNIFFRLMIVILFLSFNFPIFLILINDINLFIDDEQKAILTKAIISFSILSWLYCSFYAAQMFVKVEELENEEYFPILKDKLARFIQILYWIFGIWILQPKLNLYYDSYTKANDNNVF